MKKNIILTLILSAMLLTGCNKENELIDELETLSITAPEELTQISETEKKIIETEGETQFIFGGETETSVSEIEIAENENEYSTENFAIKIFNYGGLAPTADGVKTFYEHNYFIKDNIFGSGYGVFSADGGDIKYQIRLFDTYENKLLKIIDLPEGYMIEDCVFKTDGDELCRYIISNLIYDEENDYSIIKYAVMTIRNDLSYDISEDYTPQSRSFECCGHNIAEWERDIVDTDSGDILVEGYDGTSEYDINITRKLYKFPIDENRFVYSTGGHESIPGFGIYDFSDRTYTDVPDSRELIPIGVHGGKIYSVKAVWSGFGTDLYTTDTETLETELFMECPFNEDAADYADYTMPESGDYIALIFTPRDDKAPSVLYGIDPDTKEVVSADIPNEFEHYSLRLLKENSVMISNCSDKVLIAEIDV